ncbi:protein of unknown function [Segatella bryantii]|uniref:DUF4391 domain-containing protein n=1 Tax=Segatella bryantii TaxID=77095 RepID=UPI000899DB06|nr:DUF4391 domain-containing protein [Segatella bryantii]SDZ78345.1 protein of unknown function [Segatella bryantii]
MIDLKFPRTTMVGKLVPKTAFYKHLEVNTKIKQHFVDDVTRIDWLYKLAPSTINVEDGKLVHEIVVFSAELKSKDCPDDVFLFIDQNMPRHVVFILEYDNRYKVLLNYKEWKDGQNGQFKIIKTFATNWLADDQLVLNLEGQNMDALYEALAGQVSGFGTKKAEDTKRIVELEGLIDKAKREVATIQKRIRNERQLNRQMELNGEARGIKKQIAQWQNELQEFKQ